MEITDRLGSDATRFAWQEVYWADVLEPRETSLWNKMLAAKNPKGERIPLEWRSIREFVVHNFGDAVAYHRETEKNSAYDDIHACVAMKVKELKKKLDGPTDPIIVIAHSLGGHIMSNYIWDHQGGEEAASPEAIPTLAGMVTFGCNIPLFALSFEKTKPIDLPGKGVKKAELIAAARWLNFVDRDDVLGWPVKPLYAMTTAKLTVAEVSTVDRIEDYEINVGGLVTSWNPAAHSAYWEDNDFTIPVTTFLRSMLKALDS